MDGSQIRLRPKDDAPTSSTNATSPFLIARIRTAIDDFLRDIALWKSDDDSELVRYLRIEQRREIIRQLPLDATTGALCSLLVLVAVWEQDYAWLILPWVLLLWLGSLHCTWQWYRGRHRKAPHGNTRTLRKTVWIATAAGVIWGIPLFAFSHDGLIDGEVITVLVAAGMAAGAAAGLASLPQAAYGFVLASMLPCSLGFFWAGEVSYAAMGVAVLAFTSYLMLMTYRSYQTLLRLLRARTQQDRLSMALTRSQRMAEEAYQEIEEDLMAARSAQLRVMPKPDQLEKLHEASGVRVEGHFEPSLHLGGDHWSIICPEPHVIRFCVSDFSGHGIAAAMNSFKLVALLARMTEAVMRPAERAMRLNADLSRVVETGQFATVLLGELDIRRGSLVYAASGGPSPLIISRLGGDIVALDASGLPMGISANARYEERTYTVHADQLILLYSDALIEALDNDDRMIGREWVETTAKAHIADHGFAGIVPAIVKEFRIRAPRKLADDLTVVAMWYAPDDKRTAPQADPAP